MEELVTTAALQIMHGEIGALLQACDNLGPGICKRRCLVYQGWRLQMKKDLGQMGLDHYEVPPARNESH